MSKKTNPTLIGAFVVGATALFAIAVAVFGGAELLAPKSLFIAYFPEKTKGLRRGSSVTMNGSQIGYVSDLVLFVDTESYETTTAVTMEILPESWQVIEGGVDLGSGLDAQVPIEDLIEKGGLRAQLQAESLITGQLLIDISFHPDKPLVYRGGPDVLHPEIPSIPSNVRQFLTDVQHWVSDITTELSPTELAQHLDSILRGLDALVHSSDLHETLAGTNRLINSDATQALSGSLQAELEALRGATADASRLLKNSNTALAEELGPAIREFTSTMTEAQSTLAAAREQIRGDSALNYRLSETLREVEGAARSMNAFFDYLERNPEALLKGKRP